VTEPVTSSTPKHLWIVGVLSLLWNGFGAMDYVMTQTRNEGYMASFTPEQLEFFYGIPAWAVALWALAVWGGVAGSILLLLRRAVAAPVFLVSFVCAVLVAVQNYLLSNGLEAMGGGFPLVFSGVILVVAFLLYRYANKMRRQGVLA